MVLLQVHVPSSRVSRAISLLVVISDYYWPPSYPNMEVNSNPISVHHITTKRLIAQCTTTTGLYTGYMNL